MGGAGGSDCPPDSEVEGVGVGCRVREAAEGKMERRLDVSNLEQRVGGEGVLLIEPVESMEVPTRPRKQAPMAMTKNIYVGLLVLHSRHDRVALVFGYVFCSVVIARTGVVVFLFLFDIY